MQQRHIAKNMPIENKLIPGIYLLDKNISADEYKIHGYACRVGWDWETERKDNTTQVISEFCSKWKVPPAPKKQSNQTIFLFNAMVLSTKLVDNTYPENPVYTKAIIQPVLQWGNPKTYGGGPYWSVSSWYVKTKETTVTIAVDDNELKIKNIRRVEASSKTLPIRVNAGDLLTGVIRQKKDTKEPNSTYYGESYTCICEFAGIAGTSLVVQSSHEFVRGAVTLEAYNISQCEELPDSDYTSYTDIILKQDDAIIHPRLDIFSVANECNIRAEISGEDKINIYYR